MAIEKVENKKENQKSKFSETINSNEGKKVELDPNEEVDDDETIQAEFEEEQTANNFASQPTKINNALEEQIDPNTSASDIKKQVEDYEESKSGRLEYKDLKQTAEFLITLMDTALSTLFKFLARDTSSIAYSIPVANKRLLVEQLALILAKYQSKFKVEFLFFMGIIVLYAPMAIECIKRRKLTSKTSKKENLKTVVETIKKVAESENIELEKTEQIIEQIQKVEDNRPKFVPRRKKGGQNKP